MRIWVFSDLHLEFGERFDGWPPADTDIVVCAGDLLNCGVVPSVEWLAKNVAPSLPVVFVAGNHEHYGASLREGIRDARELAARHANIHFLENDAVDVGDVRFLGGTLWTDFRILEGDPHLTMATAQSGMTDYRKIKLRKLPFQRFKPIHAYRFHNETRRFLTSELGSPRSGKTVVVTHHAPSRRSISSEFLDDPLSACYASDLEGLILEGAPTLWIHGHVHHRNDYLIGSCRVISNPRGYPGEGTSFDPTFTVEI